MRAKIFTSVALALLMTVFMGASARAQDEESVLDKVQRTKKLKVCFAQGVPDNYKHPQTGEWTGPMVDLVDELADWMKVEVEPVEVTWDIAVLSLKRGDCDLFGSSIVYNAPRAMQINYVKFFWAKGINAVIPAGNPKGLEKPADMNSEDVTIAVVVGTREHEVAQRLFPKAKVLAMKVRSSPETANAVRRGDADAAFMPSITVRWFMQVEANQEWAQMGFPGQNFGNAPNGWAIRYGDRKWKDFLDSFSGWVEANHLAEDLYAEYIRKTNPFQE